MGNQRFDYTICIDWRYMYIFEICSVFNTVCKINIILSVLEMQTIVKNCDCLCLRMIGDDAEIDY